MDKISTKSAERASQSDVTTPAPAPKTTQAPVPAFKIKNTVTLPLSKWSVDTPKYLLITAPIFLGKQVSDQKGQNGDMAPAHLFRGTDLLTGEQVEVIAGTVLMETLKEAYPDDGYVGLQFMITQHKVEGKRYKTYSVTEIEMT